MIIISSKRDGFRRCGVAHSKAPVEHPDDKFTEKELAMLEADPMLKVDAVIAITPTLKDMTVAELKALLVTLKVPHDTRATKAVLIELVEINTDELSSED